MRMRTEWTAGENVEYSSSLVGIHTKFKAYDGRTKNTKSLSKHTTLQRRVNFHGQLRGLSESQKYCMN